VLTCVVALHYFDVLIILFVCFKCHQEQDPDDSALTVNANIVHAGAGTSSCCDFYFFII